MGHAQQTAFKWSGNLYTRHQPQSGLLYKIVQESLRSFEDLCVLEGKTLPAHVVREFEAFLKCVKKRCQHNKKVPADFLPRGAPQKVCWHLFLSMLTILHAASGEF